MKKGKISFRIIGGSGPLSISWFQGPKGDAVEAKNEIGVGFFAEDGELLAVEFDDVEEKKDHQVLEFDRYEVEVAVERGHVSFKVKDTKQTERKHNKTTRKRWAA